MLNEPETNYNQCLRLAKSLPQYRDKSRLENDRLVINGIGYTLNKLNKLPPDIAVYKTAEKSDSETIVSKENYLPGQISIMHHLSSIIKDL